MSLTTLRAFLSSPWKRKDTLCEHSREADYSPLLRDDEIQTSSESEILSTRPEGQKDSVPRSKSFCNPLFVFNVILTVFNCALAFSVWHYTRNLPLQTSFYPVHRLSHGDIARLRRPSQFINLEKMYTSIRPQPRTFKNWPLILAPIDPDHPDKAFSHDPKRHMTIVGSISPEDRQFHVTSKVSTIVQFRAIDFMMNFCQLVVKPPVDAVTGTNDLEIYELNEGFPITAKELTFANRPRRRGSPLALTRAHNGSEWRHSFVCPSDKIFTFEFGCGAGSICDIGWWQTKEPRDTGIFMIQSSVEIA